MQPPLHGTLVMMDAVAITLSPHLCMWQTGRMQEDGARGERRSLGNDRHKFFGKCHAAKKMTLHGVKGQKKGFARKRTGCRRRQCKECGLI